MSKKSNGKNKGKKGKKKVVIAIVIVVLVIGGVVGFMKFRQMKTANAMMNEMSMMGGYSNAMPEIRDISDSITGSGALEVRDSYTVKTLSEGKVMTVNFAEDQKVTKGQELCVIHNEDLEKKAMTDSDFSDEEKVISRAQKSLDKTMEDRGKLLVKADISGMIIEVNCEKGEQISTGQQLLKIENRGVMKLRVPFEKSEALNYSIGMAAVVVMDGSFEEIDGRVTKINPVDEVLPGNRIVRYITIEVNNPGGIAKDQVATANIGTVGSSKSGKFEPSDTSIISADISGKVEEVTYSLGDVIHKGDIVVTLSSTSLDEQIENAKDNLENANDALKAQMKQVEDTKKDASNSFTAPIDGTVVQKNVKIGDNVESGADICMIYDLSALLFTMNIDEMDIAKVKVGQKVIVTANAIENKEYYGEVTRVGVNGDVGNGVTTYPVKVQLDETEGLLPGMNIKAEVEFEARNGVLAIPSDAVQRGDKVMISETSPSAAEKIDEPAEPGYVYVKVVTGISDGEFVEIISGLTEGDDVYYTPSMGEPPMGMGFYEEVYY